MENLAGERRDPSPPHEDEREEVREGRRMSRWEPFSVTICAVGKKKLRKIASIQRLSETANGKDTKNQVQV